MSENNLNRFGETSNNQRFNELIDAMIIAQTHLVTYRDPESTILIYKNEIGELYNLLDDKILTITSDNIILPVIEESGDISGSQMSAGAVTGSFNSVCAGFVGLSELEEPEPLLGIKLYMGESESNSVVGSKQYQYFAFIPFAGASIHIDEDVLSEFQPEIDDEICHKIDDALLNETISFPKLLEIFEYLIDPEIDDDGDAIVSLRHEVYLRYLNNLASFNHVTALAGFGISKTNGGVQLHKTNETEFMLEGAFSGFELYSINIDEEYRIKLAVTAINEYGEKVAVLVSGISEIELH
ncbi:hypothetical protein H6801_03620 [Candidatus Nomurabacteria bacterium]|nr:hypothetical protein [Candidatus Nomurabacteria bacterium]